MASTAILIGNSAYEREDALPCCEQDVAATKALIEATGRFDTIYVHVDIEADAMRDAIRVALPTDVECDEIFFYFSGHGAQVASELFYCGTNYDGGRPNATGLSQTELIDLLRAASPDTLIMVIDACFSGALLVKSNQPMKPVPKEGFRNVLQFSSSLDNQTSLGGDPLSAFTRAFLEASVRKTEGAVYYTDLVNIIRDDFLGNEEQTPFFVNQGTGREVLVDDATQLTGFWSQLETKWGAHGPDDEDETVDGQVVVEPQTPKQLLMTAEARMGSPEGTKALINKLFDGLLGKFNESEFAEFFEFETTEHSTYREPTIRDFMIRVLSREQRPDRLVNAEIERIQKRTNPWESVGVSAMMALNTEWTEHFILELNCKLERAQLKITLNPKYTTLQQIQLVVSCAPSLESCYIFELVTQHPRTDWNAFDLEGREIIRRWYEIGWDDAVDGIIDKSCQALAKAVRDHIGDTIKRLS